MKIVSWNVWVNSKNQCKNLDQLIQDEQPEIICLQEVNLTCLNRLKNQNVYEVYEAVDYYSFKHRPHSEFYLVILVKKDSFEKVEHHRFPVSHLTKFSIWEKLNLWHESVEFHYVDLYSGSEKYRVFNVHLEVSSGPQTRLSQLKECLERFDNKGQNIICGDFNVFAHPVINWMIGWLMGFQWHEYGIEEREAFENLFAENGLRNNHFKQTTYPKFRLQLDHILTQDDAKVAESKVLDSLYGSDHKPVKLVLN